MIRLISCGDNCSLLEAQVSQVKMLSQKVISSDPGDSSASSSRSMEPNFQEMTCQYQTRLCHLPSLESYNYCIKHILEDKSAPYRPCSYTYPNTNKKCINAALKSEKKDIGYCQMHLWKMLLKRQKSGAKNVPPMTTESLLSELSHYVRPARGSWPKPEIQEKNDPSTTNALNPFVDVDVSKASLKRVQILECASESDSDNEMATLESVWKGTNEDSSDNESIDDSQIEDPLRRANVYTAEEVVALARNRMMRLQMLYQRQFEKLTQLLKEKRRNYFVSLKKEKETMGPLHSLPRNTAKEQRMYEKFKALTRYHRLSKKESVAYILNQEKRKASQSGAVKQATKCIFVDGGVRCPEIVLPLSRYCLKHILQDSSQCLFRACGCEKMDSTCQEPVVEMGSEDSCVLHLKFSNHSNVTFPVIKNEDGDKNGDAESELDASATESAFSTDNRDSPEGHRGLDEISTIHNEDCKQNNDDINESFFSPDANESNQMKQDIQEEMVIEETVIEEVVLTDNHL